MRDTSRDEYRRQWRLKNKDKTAKYNARQRAKTVGLPSYKKFKSIESYIVSNARSRAKKYGREFSITASSFTIPEFCPILGIKLESGLGSMHHANSPSLDRIDNRIGYVDGNVRIISNRANRLKSDATPDELRLLAADTARQMARQELKNE